MVFFKKTYVQTITKKCMKSKEIVDILFFTIV